MAVRTKKTSKLALVVDLLVDLVVALGEAGFADLRFKIDTSSLPVEATEDDFDRVIDESMAPIYRMASDCDGVWSVLTNLVPELHAAGVVDAMSIDMRNIGEALGDRKGFSRQMALAVVQLKRRAA